MYISTHDEQDWHAITENGVYQVVGVNRKTGELLGEHGGGLIATIARCEDRDDRISNARLIAAAPQLLMHLINMTEWADCGAFCNASEDEIRDARSAIEKALFGEE